MPSYRAGDHPSDFLSVHGKCLQDFHYIVKVDWQTKDEAHPSWTRIYRAVDVVESVVYDVLPSQSNNFGTDLDNSPARRLLWSECRSWLEMDCDLDEQLHLECLQHAAPIIPLVPNNEQTIK